MKQQQGGSGGGSYTSANTMDVKLRNEPGDEVIQFQHRILRHMNRQRSRWRLNLELGELSKSPRTMGNCGVQVGVGCSQGLIEEV